MEIAGRFLSEAGEGESAISFPVAEIEAKCLNRWPSSAGTLPQNVASQGVAAQIDLKPRGDDLRGSMIAINGFLVASLKLSS